MLLTDDAVVRGPAWELPGRPAPEGAETKQPVEAVEAIGRKPELVAAQRAAAVGPR